MTSKSATERAAEIQAATHWSVARIGAVVTIAAALISAAAIIYSRWGGSELPQSNQTLSIGANGSQNISLQNSSENTIIVSPSRVPLMKETFESPKEPPSPPPEDIPELSGFHLRPLTDDDRKTADYSSTIVDIQNDTPEVVRLAYTIQPLKSSIPDSSLSRYVHIVTNEILPGETLSDERHNFGGPMHLAVYARGQWYSMNEWVDLRIVAKRIVKSNARYEWVYVQDTL